MDVGAISHGLAFDSQSIGWSAVGAALHNHCVGARYACSRGYCYRSRSSAGQLRLVDCWDDCSSERQHTGWLFCRNADSTWLGRPLGKQILLLFSYHVSAKHPALAPARAGQPSSLRGRQFNPVRQHIQLEVLILWRVHRAHDKVQRCLKTLRQSRLSLRRAWKSSPSAMCAMNGRSSSARHQRLAPGV